MDRIGKEILDLLPYKYNKRETSNNYKIVKLLEEVVGGIIKHQQEVKASNDIDNAEGKVLDLVGSNYSQPREPGQPDDEYRLFIKTKIAADMSQGDIETLNEIAETILGGNFIGIKETWSDPSYKEDIAGIVIKIKPELKRLPKIMHRVRAAGVSLYYEMMLKDEEVIIENSKIEYGTRYPMTHETSTASKRVDGNKNEVEVVNKYIKAKTNYEMAGQITTAAVKNNISNLKSELEIKQAKGGISYNMTYQTITGGN